MTTPADLDQQITDLMSMWQFMPLTEDAKQAILATLRAHKALIEAMEREMPKLPVFTVALTSIDGQERMYQEYPAVLKHDYDALLAKLAKVTAERDAAVKDAERYRLARNKLTSAVFQALSNHDSISAAEELDAAIDRAIAGKE